MFSSPVTPSENYDEFRNLLQNEIFWFEMLEVSSFKFNACCSWESYWARKITIRAESISGCTQP